MLLKRVLNTTRIAGQLEKERTLTPEYQLYMYNVARLPLIISFVVFLPFQHKTVHHGVAAFKILPAILKICLFFLQVSLT